MTATLRTRLLAIVVAFAASMTTLFVVAAPSRAQWPCCDGGGLSGLRQDTVDRARSALNNPRKYRVGGTYYMSDPNTAFSPPYNYLGRNGSNSNQNVYNDYNGLAWCGYFAAAIWTGTITPNPADFPRIPDNYASSQAWRTGSAYHSFNADNPPTPGDAVIWQDGSGSKGVDNGSATGHVGVVISVNYANHWITTIEGNQWVYNADGSLRNRDSIVEKKYHWASDGMNLSGKHFMGTRSRE